MNRLRCMSFALLALSMLLPAPGVRAQTLYKCAGANGSVAWQSMPCGAGARVLRSFPFTPEPPVAKARATSPRTARSAKAPKQAIHHAAATRQRHPKPDACARARTAREATLERVGLKRDYDLLSRLDAEVRRACR